MKFDFATAGRILFGAGTYAQLPSIAGELGRRILLVRGATARADAAFAACEFAVRGEPTIDAVCSGVALARNENCDAVVAVGGGSAIDAGKAIAALAANPGEPLDYLEVVGRGQPLERPALPFIAVPTTSGTGSEVTRNAVLASPEHGVKASLRGAYLLPRVAVVDPDLTLGLPPAVTANTGLDALTQLIEPYLSIRANAFTDPLALEGIAHAASSLRRAFEDGADRKARAGMSMASLLGGLCLANAGLGAVHGFAAPIGGSFHAPHGAVCAALLPHAMRANLAAVRQRAPERVERFNTVARVLCGSAQAAAEDGIEWIADTCEALRIAGLRAYGIAETRLPSIAANAARASSMKANPVALSEEELLAILRAAL